MTKAKLTTSAAAIKRAEINYFIVWFHGPNVRLITLDAKKLKELGFPSNFKLRQNEIHLIKGKDRRGKRVCYYILSTINEKSDYGDFLLNERSFDILLEIEEDEKKKTKSSSLGFAVYKDGNIINSYITFLSDIDRDFETDDDIQIKEFDDKDAGNAISVMRTYKGVLTRQSNLKNREKADKGYKNRRPKK